MYSLQSSYFKRSADKERSVFRELNWGSSPTEPSSLDLRPSERELDVSIDLATLYVIQFLPGKGLMSSCFISE
jgi:hypothetical protein